MSADVELLEKLKAAVEASTKSSRRPMVDDPYGVLRNLAKIKKRLECDGLDAHPLLGAVVSAMAGMPVDELDNDIAVEAVLKEILIPKQPNPWAVIASKVQPK